MGEELVHCCMTRMDLALFLLNLRFIIWLKPPFQHSWIIFPWATLEKERVLPAPDVWLQNWNCAWNWAQLYLHGTALSPTLALSPPETWFSMYTEPVINPGSQDNQVPAFACHALQPPLRPIWIYVNLTLEDKDKDCYWSASWVFGGAGSTHTHSLSETAGKV